MAACVAACGSLGALVRHHWRTDIVRGGHGEERGGEQGGELHGGRKGGEGRFRAVWFRAHHGQLQNQNCGTRVPKVFTQAGRLPT